MPGLAARVALCEALVGGELVVGRGRCTIVEVELYARGEDPFVHGQVEQHDRDGWYLHRVGRGFRGGSFKGVDLVCGGDGWVGGVLLRTLDTPDGRVCGPSLVVDWLIERTRTGSVAGLYAKIRGRSARREGPLWVAGAGETRVWRTPRVGLSTKTADPRGFREAPYRFLSDPAVAKGRRETARGLVASGLDLAEVAALMKAREGSVARWTAGRSKSDGGRQVQSSEARDTSITPSTSTTV